MRALFLILAAAALVLWLERAGDPPQILIDPPPAPVRARAPQCESLRPLPAPTPLPRRVRLDSRGIA